ncbi:MAG: imidazolonepropionase [Actinomycetota bacterium]
MTSIVLRDAASVIPFVGDGPVRGDAMGAIEVLEGASVAFDGGRVLSVGPTEDAEIVFDASGCTVTPGFVDCHTHLPFFGWRADEDAARLAGSSYQALHSEDKGIYRSARMLAGAPDNDVLEFSQALAAEMLALGTTTFETKSGYGLGVEAELRQLRFARALGERVPQKAVTTCLAAHAVPKGRSEDDWVREAAEELLPSAAKEGLCSAVDVYVEAIAFRLEHAARLAEVADRLGLRMRIHADQLDDSGAASFAAGRGFASADHLNHTSLDAVGELASSETVAVLLPGATFTLCQEKRPPARSLIESGAIVALGSDLNPGTSPIRSMPFVISLACRLYGLRPLEALAAATVNAAHALGLEAEVGRLAPGYRADAVVLDAPSFEMAPYRPDHDQVLAVVCGGKLVHLADGAHQRVKRTPRS